MNLMKLDEKEVKLFSAIRFAAEQLLNDKETPVLIVTHLDADGLSAGGIIASTLARANIPFQVQVKRQLEDEIIESIADLQPPRIIFTDFGSGQFVRLKEKFKDSSVIILDHHPPIENDESPLVDNWAHVNPHLVGIDSSHEISGAGLAFFFAQEIDPKNNDLAVLGIVGAIGDRQEGEENKFSNLNQMMVEEGLKSNLLNSFTGIRLFGRETRPIHRILQYSTEPFIPDITGNEDNAVRFLKEIGIPLKEGDRWRTIADLTKQERTIFTSALVKKMILGGVSPNEAKKIVGPNYILNNEELGSPLRDAREFSTFLNACGRLGKPSIGIAVCMGDRGYVFKQGIEISNQYRGEISDFLIFLEDNIESITEFDGMFYLNAKTEIKDTAIGTIASIAMGNRIIDPSKPLIMAALSDDSSLKMSGRGTNELVARGLDLGQAMREALAKINAGDEGGGHNVAAGARIAQELEEPFIQALNEIISLQLTE